MVDANFLAIHALPPCHHFLGRPHRKITQDTGFQGFRERSSPVYLAEEGQDHPVYGVVGQVRLRQIIAFPPICSHRPTFWPPLSASTVDNHLDLREGLQDPGQFLLEIAEASIDDPVNDTSMLQRLSHRLGPAEYAARPSGVSHCEKD